PPQPGQQDLQRFMPRTTLAGRRYTTNPPPQGSTSPSLWSSGSIRRGCQRTPARAWPATVPSGRHPDSPAYPHLSHRTAPGGGVLEGPQRDSSRTPGQLLPPVPALVLAPVLAMVLTARAAGCPSW